MIDDIEMIETWAETAHPDSEAVMIIKSRIAVLRDRLMNTSRDRDLLSRCEMALAKIRARRNTPEQCMHAAGRLAVERRNAEAPPHPEPERKPCDFCQSTGGHASVKNACPFCVERWQLACDSESRWKQRAEHYFQTLKDVLDVTERAFQGARPQYEHSQHCGFFAYRWGGKSECNCAIAKQRAAVDVALARIAEWRRSLFQ